MRVPREQEILLAYNVTEMNPMQPDFGWIRATHPLKRPGPYLLFYIKLKIKYHNIYKFGLISILRNLFNIFNILKFFIIQVLKINIF